MNEKPKKILANRVYSDATLKSWTKADLIEQIRILEHNWSCTEERFNNSVKNSEKIFYEQKAEIERLTEELDDTVSMNDMYIKCVKENAELQKQIEAWKAKSRELDEAWEIASSNEEKLQKQVDELKDRLRENLEHLKQGKELFEMSKGMVEQAVKDTAEKFAKEIDDLTLCIIDGGYEFDKGYFHAIADMKTAIKDLIKEHYGVEVE